MVVDTVVVIVWHYAWTWTSCQLFSVRPYVTLMYCFKNVTFFRPGSPIICTFWGRALLHISKVNPSVWALNKHEFRKTQYSASISLSLGITGCTVAQHCYNGDVSFVLEKWKLWPPVKSKPLKRLTQFVRIDNVHEMNVCSKFGKNPFTGDFWAKGWNITFCVTYLFILFFVRPHREETSGRILTRNGSKDAESRKDVPFWVIKWKIEIWPLFTPKPQKFGPE